MLALSWAASSLTLTASASLAALPLAQEQAGEASKESSSVSKTKESSTGEKIVTDPDSEFNAARPLSLKALGKTKNKSGRVLQSFDSRMLSG
jgi:hypothetical protein